MPSPFCIYKYLDKFFHVCYYWSYKSFFNETEGRLIVAMEDILTVAQVATYLKVTPQYVRKLIKENRLKSSRVGKQWLIAPSDLQKFIKDDDFFIEPDDHERRSSDIPPLIALSFFSGAMGLDLGMEKGGIKSLLACEFNKYCRMTIAKNRPEMALIGDINKYTAEDILKLAKIPKDRQIDVIFGGPPCQAFSTAGNRKGFEDERGNVFLRYLEIVSELKPKYVVIENVRGLLSTPYQYGRLKSPIKGGALCVILERLKQAGYAVSFNLYNAANYGAPQIRERVVMIGKLGNQKVPYLYPTNSNDPKYQLSSWKTLEDAFNTLKVKQHHHIEFPENRLKYYRLLREGQYWKDLPKDLQVEAMGNKLKLGGGKTGFFRRLAWKKPSPTLVTNPTMPATDLCHPTENRPLSVEEYSKIQGFPESWEICGPILEQYKQIGNAVPIKLGEAIARTIIDDMKGIDRNPPADFPYSRYKNTSDITWAEEKKKKIKKELEKQNEESMIPLFE